MAFLGMDSEVCVTNLTQMIETRFIYYMSLIFIVIRFVYVICLINSGISFPLLSTIMS